MYDTANVALTSGAECGLNANVLCEVLLVVVYAYQHAFYFSFIGVRIESLECWEAACAVQMSSDSVIVILLLFIRSLVSLLLLRDIHRSWNVAIDFSGAESWMLVMNSCEKWKKDLQTAENIKSLILGLLLKSGEWCIRISTVDVWLCEQSS